MKNPLLKKATLTFVLSFLSMFGYSQVARELETSNHIISNNKEDKDILAKKFHEIKYNPLLPIRGKAHRYEGEYLGAIQFPVGGLGSGCIQFDGDARPRYWQIFNNMTHDYIPNSFMAIRVQRGGETEIRALQTKDIAGIKGMKTLSCVNEFPFLRYDFEDNLPISTSLTVYNPFIPTDLKNSSIPAVFYEVVVTNNSTQSVEVDLLASQQNAIGFSRAGVVNNNISFADNYKLSLERELIDGNKSKLYSGNINKIVDIDGAKVLEMNSTISSDDEHYGQMALILFDNKKGLKNSSGIASWQSLDSFESGGVLEDNSKLSPSEQASTYSGALTSKVVLKAGQSKVFNLALAWYFPNGISGGSSTKWDAWGNGKWHGKGNYYATQWDSIDNLVSYLVENREKLYSESRLFQSTLFETNLPYWLMERLSSQLAIIKSRTIFHAKDGYVGLWEGCGAGDGSCAGNCNHVWHYAQAHARLFPELARKIREQTYKYIKENGQIPYRQPAGSDAFDGQCGDILSTYREHLLSSDNTWLKSQYPKVKMAMEYIINGWDSDRDGWLQGSMHTTYDCSMSGNASFLTSLYMAALKSAIEMATICEDRNQADEWNILYEKAKTIQNKRLWNGEYYIQIPDTTNRASDYENGCHSDQLLGQWWANQLGLGELFPTHRINAAFNAVLDHNFKSIIDYHKQSPREFAKAGEPAFIVTTWPNNDRPKSAPGYSDEVWSTYEYTIAASLFYQQQPLDALTLLKAGAMRYDGKLRTGYSGDWGNFGFSGNPFGDDECGQFYSRALSNWSILMAVQGFEYDGPKGELTFNPNWKNEDHTSFFSTSCGWGLFSQVKINDKQTNKIELRYGNLKLNKLTIDNLMAATNCTVNVLVNGKEIVTKIDISEANIAIDLGQIYLTKGDIIEITTL